MAATEPATDLVGILLNCLCKQLRVIAHVPTSSLPLSMTLCHCNICNAVTGQLCATVCALPNGSRPLEINGAATGYKTSGALERFFCATCGSSVYEDKSGMAPGMMFLDTGAFDVGEVEVRGKKVP